MLVNDLLINMDTYTVQYMNVLNSSTFSFRYDSGRFIKNHNKDWSVLSDDMQSWLQSDIE